MSGSLLSHDALGRLLRVPGRFEIDLGERSAAQRTLAGWHTSLRARFGPATGPRTVFDCVAVPLLRTLGFEVVPTSSGAEVIEGVLHAGGQPVAVLLVPPWGHPLKTMWRRGVQRGLGRGVGWCVCVNGPSLCVFDVGRAYSRRHLEFDLAAALESGGSLSVLCGLTGATALAGVKGQTVLDEAVRMCERHRTEVRLSLREGVREALVLLISAFRRAVRRHEGPVLLNESLIVVYRILFLLFAEARGLVPSWHPVYQDSYTVGKMAAESGQGALPAGVWEGLQAVARLAHRGCRAGSLTVPPFNGRLFSPAGAPLADAVPLDDGTVSKALEALTTRSAAGGREAVAYADLGVEQLGGVYEHLLDFDVAPGASDRTRLVPTGRRKATGSFYTPRALTEFVVRRTLGPAVWGRSPEEILALRVLDPAMGSGAFLVAACRYLASAYERALVREGAFTPGDVTDEDRADFRRSVAQRCLFGVDVNPMAVQLARLSLWLTTLARDKPLTFLDHRLRTGNSLAGASIDDIVRRPMPAGRARRAARLPLFAEEDLQASLESVVVARRALAEVPDDTLEQVRGKERSLVSLQRDGGPIARWRRAADVWCAGWFAPALAGEPRTFGALLDHVLRSGGPLPEHTAAGMLSAAREVAAQQRFFHWALEFPEIFYDDEGMPRHDGGFDVILGNPPWDMLRRDGPGSQSAGLTRYVREARQYRLQGQGHTNVFQLFFERSLQLLKPRGWCGLILPSGFATDEGSALLRRQLLDRAGVETFTTLDNRDGIFPIHRALKFLLLTFHMSGATVSLPMRTGLRSADALDAVPDTGPDPDALAVPRELVARMSGEGLAVPEIRTPIDLRITSSITLRVPAMADPEGWGVHFGRELNATDDRPHFGAGAKGLPVIEGKQLRPFAIDLDAVTNRIAATVAARLLDPSRTFGRARLAYRDVASPTNRLTLISAIVPAGAVTTHTVYCVKELLGEDEQWFLCGVFNSYVANYLVRMRVGTHVTAAIVSRLPVPKPRRGDPSFVQIVTASRALAGREDQEALARLNAAAAHLYGLEGAEFEHVLGTFPLVPAQDREAALRCFCRRPVA